MTTNNEAPPLHPQVPEEVFDKMTREERREYTFQRERSAIARYGGRPELFLKENPQLDFLHQADPKQIENNLRQGMQAAKKGKEASDKEFDKLFPPSSEEQNLQLDFRNPPKKTSPVP
jgi:hypothetical protein